ncbi:unnamed protein product, partial [Ixodes hexagonus]
MYPMRPSKPPSGVWEDPECQPPNVQGPPHAVHRHAGRPHGNGEAGPQFRHRRWSSRHDGVPGHEEGVRPLRSGGTLRCGVPNPEVLPMRRLWAHHRRLRRAVQVVRPRPRHDGLHAAPKLLCRYASHCSSRRGIAGKPGDTRNHDDSHLVEQRGGR